MRAADYVALMVMAAAGMTLAALALMLASWVAWCAGAQLWHRMHRIYRLATIWHYLAQLERNNGYRFPPPDKDNP